MTLVFALLLVLLNIGSLFFVCSFLPYPFFVFNSIVSAILGWVCFFVVYGGRFVSEVSSLHKRLTARRTVELSQVGVVAYVQANLDKFGVRDSGCSSLDAQEIFVVPYENMGF